MFPEIVGAIMLPPLIWAAWIYIKHLVDCLVYPRGPFPLPFVGNAYLFSKGKPYKEFVKLGKTYGNVFGFSIGSIRYVVVNSLEGIQEVLIKKGSHFAGRPKIAKQSTLNIICTILFNHRYEDDNQEFQDIIKYSSLIVQTFNETSYVSSIPLLRYFPTATSRNIFEIIRLRDPILKRKLQEHRKSYDENNLRDITDALIKVSLDSEMGEELTEKITDDNIEFLLNDFMIAGSETSSSTILWFIVYMLHWPEYQNKLYDEITKVASDNRYVSLKDRPMLHLMQAAIHETLRLSSVVPLGLVHKAMENSSICGKFVPKGALILTNLWSMHHDESYWKNAMSFYPERWLEKSGEFNYKLGYAYLPFSNGPRSCLGETLAKTELFVFITRLLKDYRFEMPTGKELPCLDGRSGITSPPNDFEVVIIPRN
ncbi:steroid 17-alpha-hydroxylase/17,20 lyase isoform X2 [Hydra vulgaris]|uniref:steroid 17-alpha-hydroxylase/17,20 lyase isoform X2 n=1 Tax=Hydra vulgaris TaxID=6087 RepID=UPI001F5FA4D0|nr:steroid 17-alpha-hydroxylase/17,20 lyase isoform X2 [Hydra vulgaris]